MAALQQPFKRFHTVVERFVQVSKLQPAHLALFAFAFQTAKTGKFSQVRFHRHGKAALHTNKYSKTSIFGVDGVIESISVLLEWIEADPVDTWELGRNDAVQSITGTRNVFVDYPEYAWLLFGYAVPNEMQTPSNNAKNGLAGGENLPQAPEYKPETPEVDASLEELLAKDSLTIFWTITGEKELGESSYLLLSNAAGLSVSIMCL